MEWARVLFSRFAAFFRNGKLDQQLEDELRAHIDLATLENCDRGLSPDEARAAALRSFGGIAQIKETYRSQRGLPWLEEWIRDLQFAFRGLRKSPGFTSTALLTLALGIGAVTSVFSVVNAVLLTPFAFSDPQRLIVLREAVDDNHTGRSAIPVNYRHFLRLVEQTKTIEKAAIFHQRGSSVGVKGEHPKIVGTIVASSNLFHVLGIQPMLGRGFAEADSGKGAEPVVVLSYEAWRGFFGGDENAIGRTLLINGESVPVIGVLPPVVKFPNIKLAPAIPFYESAHDARLFQPLQPSNYDLKADMGNFNYRVIARLKQGASIPQASSELDTLQRSYSLSAHLPFHLGISLTPLTQDVASGISGAIWLLFAAVGAVLLIACVNLASLQLARAVNADRQTAVCAALGANRLQLIRSRLSESLLPGAGRRYGWSGIGIRRRAVARRSCTGDCSPTG